MSLTMSRAEREEFLAGLHVGVLGVASLDGPGGSQVMIRMTPEHWLSRAYSDG